MYAIDFEYDGQYLSDYGFIVCDFNGSSGANIASAGSKIVFNTVSRHRGERHGLTGTQYNECIQAKFDICKDPEIHDDLQITDDEYMDLMRWLNRDEFLKFQVLDEEKDKEACYFDASFNIDKVKIREILYGLELTMETNRPFGYGQEIVHSFVFGNSKMEHTLMDASHKIGYTYPSLKITCNADGDLYIKNETIDCTTLIRNCENGEVIEIDGDTMIITSSHSGHDICNDFNYEFFKISNSFNDRNNRIATSLPCKLEIKYSPIIKDAP